MSYYQKYCQAKQADESPIAIWSHDPNLVVLVSDNDEQGNPERYLLYVERLIVIKFYETILCDSIEIHRTCGPVHADQLGFRNVRDIQRMEDASYGCGILWNNVGVQRMAE